LTEPQPHFGSLNRREFLQRAGGGFGMLGLASLLGEQGLLAAPTAAPVHFSARAKSVIWLFMFGGPSAFDLFDYKPELQKNHGKKLEGKGEIKAFFGRPGPLMKSPFAFQRHGQSGAWVSELYPTVARHVDNLAFLKAVHCESNNHLPAMLQLSTGMTRVGFPSVGSWVTYGLGSENRDLPGFIVMHDHRAGPVGGAQNWGAGFLPGSFQGVPLRASGAPLLNLTPPGDLAWSRQRTQMELLRELNDRHLQAHPGEADLAARIASYEMAFRMQIKFPGMVDIAKEPPAIRKLYGVDREPTRHYGTQLLMARRLVQQGVRFIQVYSGGGGGNKDNWDAHDDLKTNHVDRCAETDVPIAGLLADLKQQGLLDSTLVIWGGEFGRLPVSQFDTGRDHNPHGFLMWMAGAGIKPGTSFGETDEVGYRAAQDPVTIPDVHATILHQLGMDHRRLTYDHNGRKYRLTDVSGEVIKKILA
jgi:hypothetical protein